VSDLVEGKAVLVDPDGRELITLNSVGTLVWGSLDGSHGVAELCRVVSERYPTAPASQVEGDVRTFLDQLTELKLVTNETSAPD